MTGEEAKPSYFPIDQMAAHIAPKGSEQGGYLRAAGLGPFVLTAQSRRNGGDDLIPGLGSRSWSLGSWTLLLALSIFAVQLASDLQGHVCAIPSPSYRAGAFPQLCPCGAQDLSLPFFACILAEVPGVVGAIAERVYAAKSVTSPKPPPGLAECVISYVCKMPANGAGKCKSDLPSVVSSAHSACRVQMSRQGETQQRH